MTFLPPDKNVKSALMLHFGWTDLLQHVGMVRYYKTLYKTIVLVCLPHQKEFLEALYPDFELLFLQFDGHHSINAAAKKLFDEDYLILCDGHQCSPELVSSFYRQNLHLAPTTEIQRINCESFSKSSLHVCDNIKYRNDNEPGFDERISFYTLSGLDHSIAFDYFKIIRDSNAEEIKYNELVTTGEYSVVHYVDGMDLSHTNYPIIKLNDRSNKIVDTLKIIENAKEVHIYDSLYGVLCYFLYFSNQLKGPKFYLHKYARMQIPKFFDYKKMEGSGDWIVL